MLKHLMLSRRFAPIFWCQFFSALNDNVLKNALVILILFKVGGETAGAMVTLAGAVFIAPFFVLSALGGEWADKHDKARVAQRLKFAELFVAGLAGVGFYLHSVPLLMTTLGLFGVISALFGPIKYGILPDHLTPDELVSGNALVEAGTFAAILGGTVLGGIAAAGETTPHAVVALVLMIAVLCWLSAMAIPPTGAKAPDLKITRNPWTSTRALMADVKADRRLWDGTLIVSWFWLVGAVTLSLLPTLIKQGVGGDESVVTLCLAVFAVGIAIGSLAAAKASQAGPNLALVPWGGAMMALGALDLAWAGSGLVAGARLDATGFLATPGAVRLLADFSALAVGGGLFVVPAFAAVQAWSPVEKRARVIGAGNVLSAAFIVVSGVMTALAQAAGISLATVFVALGVTTAIVTVLIVRIWGRSAV